MNDRSHVRHGLRRGAYILGITALAVMVVAAPALGAKAQTKRVSINSNGAQGNGPSGENAANQNGMFIAFYSRAPNLVNGDTNGVHDCFVRDYKAKKTTRVSVSSAEVQGNGNCWGPDISSSGRFVVFESLASNLVPGDGNGTWDIFVRDRSTGTTEIVSVDNAGNEGNGDSHDPAISGDGRYVVFDSTASNLVPGDTNNRRDVFLHDRQTNRTTRLSVHKNGTQSNRDSKDPDISANGKFVVFQSWATTIVNGGANKWAQIYIHEIATGKVSRVSKRSNGAQAKKGDSANPTVSSTGRFVAFDSLAKNLIGNDTNNDKDVFLHDRKKKKTTRVSVKTGGGQVQEWSYDPTISDNGRWIAFQSHSRQLVPKDTNGRVDVFVHDKKYRKTKRVSVRTGGGQAKGGNSHEVKISGNGKVVVFESEAKNLVRGDTNGKTDVFRRGPLY